MGEGARGYLLFFSILIFVLAREGEEGDLVTLQFPWFWVLFRHVSGTAEGTYITLI